MTYLQRTITASLSKAMKTFPAVLLSGPRQSGKTTLLRHECGGSHHYVSLENPDERDRALADPKGFLNIIGDRPVILDEIQYAPELLSYIKSSIDENRAPGRWLLTGSQHFGLMAGVSQSLAGRVAVLTLLPFSRGEALGEPSADADIDQVLAGMRGRGKRETGGRYIEATDWLLRGSYPEVRANPSVDRDLWCSGYIQTYLERDVRQVTNVGDLNAFSRFLRLCAARTGQVVNFSDLARDAGVSPPTARRWISVLEAGYQVYLLPPYHRNFGKRIIKSPKLYFMEPALAAFLIGIHDPEVLLKGPHIGPLLESAVVASWAKAFHHRGKIPPLYYWRSRDGLEVDLLVDWNGRLHPFEIKASATLTPRHADALKKWRKLDGTEIEGVIMAMIDHPQVVASGVSASPWDAVS